jgi:uncharacterized membrane protein (DUF2068 family)
MTTEAQAARAPRFNILRTIAVYKLVKVLLLVALALGEVHLRDASFIDKLLVWVSARPHGLEHDVVTRLIQWLSGLTTSRMHTLRIVTLAYAAVFATEGVGLWMQKRWAEWLTVIITASLIPLEVWETIFKPTIGIAAVLVANLTIVIYLAWHVLHSRGKQPAA